MIIEKTRRLAKITRNIYQYLKKKLEELDDNDRKIVSVLLAERLLIDASSGITEFAGIVEIMKLHLFAESRELLKLLFSGRDIK